MKLVASNRTFIAVPTLAALLAGSVVYPIDAQPKTPSRATAATKTAKAPRPRSKTVQGTFVQANASSVKLNSKDGELNAVLVPTTEYWRIETGITPSNLKIGDTIRFTLRGTDGMATVQSVSPLTLKFADVATLTIDNPRRMKFERASKLTPTDLASGQTAKVASNVFPDGRIEAREVWVIVEPVRAPRKVTTPAPAN